VGCLNAWRKASRRTESFWQCENCHYKYHFQRALLAKYLSKELTIQLFTMFIFVILVISCGYLTKLIIYIASYDVDDPELIPHVHVIETVWHGEEASLWKLDFDHVIIGLYSVGALGFFHFFISFFRNPLGPFPNLRISSRHPNDRVGSFVCALLIFIGIAKTIYTIYKTVKKISRQSLIRLETAILEVNES
jgi:hypothetical protein